MPFNKEISVHEEISLIDDNIKIVIKNTTEKINNIIDDANHYEKEVIDFMREESEKLLFSLEKVLIVPVDCKSKKITMNKELYNEIIDNEIFNLYAALHLHLDVNNKIEFSSEENSEWKIRIRNRIKCLNDLYDLD